MSKEFEEKVMQKFEENDKRHEEFMRRFEESDKRFESFEKRVMQRFEENDKRHEAFEKKVMQKFSEHDEILADLKRSILLIEDYVTNKIPALFDAYSLNAEHHERIDNKIDKLENVTDTHSLKISILEENSKAHSKQLAKLTS